MSGEAEIVQRCVDLVEHLEQLNSHMILDKNYGVIMKYALLNMRRLNTDKSGLPDKGIYSLSEWTIELIRLAMCIGREVNRVRKVLGMQALEFEKEATKKELRNAKNSTLIKKDSGS